MSEENKSARDQPDRVAPPCVLAIFGATGDLSKRLLLPAVANLAEAGMLPDEFAILGIGRSERSRETFLDQLKEGIEEIDSMETDGARWAWLSEHLEYIDVDATEDDEAFERLGKRLDELGEERGTQGNVLFYLAIPPGAFDDTVHGLQGAGLTEEPEGAWRRVIVEKPFGRDLESARELNRLMWDAFDESQIFRIDHFLGKETVQNIMALRFANAIFEPIWDRAHVDHVEISVTETLGVGGRADFYDEAGALRDMVPNHLFQLLSLTAMEAPSSFEADAVRAEKVKLLRAVRRYDCEECLDRVVRARYTEGEGDGGTRAPGYLDEEGVPDDSTTETYVALKLEIDNWRWSGVPFYLRTGKRLSEKNTRVTIAFRDAPMAIFRETSPDQPSVQNFLELQLQPHPAISLRFGVKIPGQGMRIDPIAMEFRWAEYFEMPKRTGYEILVHDCMRGDATLFQRAEFVEEAWAIVEPMLQAWEGSDQNLATYRAGSRGPAEADALLAADGRSWYDPGDERAPLHEEEE